MQSVYPTAPADWADNNLKKYNSNFNHFKESVFSEEQNFCGLDKWYIGDSNCRVSEEKKKSKTYPNFETSKFLILFI